MKSLKKSIFFTLLSIIFCSCEERFQFPSELRLPASGDFPVLIVGDSVSTSVKIMNVEVKDSFKIDLDRDGTEDFVIRFYSHYIGASDYIGPCFFGSWILSSLSECSKFLCDTLSVSGNNAVLLRVLGKNDRIKVPDTWYTEPGISTVLAGIATPSWGFGIYSLIYPSSGSIKTLDSEDQMFKNHKYVGLLSYNDRSVTIGWIKICLSDGGITLEETGSADFIMKDVNFSSKDSINQ